MSDKIAVNIVGSDRKEYTIWGFKGQSVYQVLLSNGFENDGYCGGRGVCGKCKIKIEGTVNEVSETEKSMLLPEELKENIRLACCTYIQDSVTVYLNDYESLNKANLNYTVGSSFNLTENKIHSFFIPGLDKEMPIPIHRRLTNALDIFQICLTPANINELVEIDRAGRPSLELQAVILQNQVKYISRDVQGVYGIALDLGSTSLFAALVDLITGKVVAVSSKTNMQRVYGADIVSRLSYVLENEEGEKNLQQILINNVNSMIEELIAQTQIQARQIYAFTVVGNPVMMHFFAGISIRGFTMFPYIGAFVDELILKTNDLGLIGNKDADIILLPQIGGFVGADTVGCLLNLKGNNSCYLLIDIGTNGEIFLHKDGQMWATSAAAGPAFEGGQISCGVRAGEGSINKVYLNDDKTLSFSIIGDKPVRGLCGSAIIDLTACLLKGEYIDKNGIINSEATGIKSLHYGDNTHLVVYDRENIAPGRPILFTQEDIRQVQLAKSAVRTAVDLLLEVAGISYDEIDNIYLAGAFGNYLNPVNSIIIGLLPPVDPSKVKNIGNAAVNGAILALLSSEERDYAKRIAGQVNYIDLANNPSFQNHFIENLNF